MQFHSSIINALFYIFEMLPFATLKKINKIRIYQFLSIFFLPRRSPRFFYHKHFRDVCIFTCHVLVFSNLANHIELETKKDFDLLISSFPAYRFLIK